MSIIKFWGVLEMRNLQHFHWTTLEALQLYITNKTECFSFKSGRAVCIAKLTKTDWFVVLQ